MEHVNQMKSNDYNDPYYKNIVNRIENFDQYLDFINGDFPKKDFAKVSDVTENTNCQPVNYLLPSMLGYKYTEERNLSNCIIDLKFTNHGPQVLEDYKLYITFSDVIEVDSVNKRKSWDDLYKYQYNVSFIEDNKAEFIPKQNVLVQNDSITIDSICFRTNHKTKSIVVKWELFARNFHDEGIMQIKISPSFEKLEHTRYEKNADEKKVKIRILPKIETY